MSEAHYTDCERVQVHKALGGIPFGFGCTCVQRTLEREREEDRAAIRELESYLDGNIPYEEAERVRAKHAAAITRAIA